MKEFYEKIVVQKHHNAILSPLHYEKMYGKDLNCLVQLGIQGIKGAAAYADHVFRLVEKMNIKDEELEKACEELMTLLNYFVFKADGECLNKALRVGSINFKITELLDKYNTQFCGKPKLTAVPTKLVPGKCIVITGHDLVDLRTLLEKCQAENINVYTHGEMMPSFMYPELSKFSCLKANYGHAW